MANLIERQAAIDALCKSECGCSNAECRHKDGADFCVTCDNVKIIKSLLSIQPERKAVFNRDIAIEAICDEVMLWFDISATKAYEIADTAVKRIEVRMEKMERGES